MAAETLVPEGLVHEYLGVRRAPRALGVNIQILNAIGQKWVSRDDILRWLQVQAHTTGVDLIDTLRTELLEATQPQKD